MRQHARTPTRRHVPLRGRVLQIVAGFMVIAQVLRGVTATMRAASVYSDRVLSGQEPTYGLLTERVVRLCGLSSDVTLLSIQRYGRHILPVFERLDHMRPMVDRISSQGKVAAVWQVRPVRARDRA